MERFATRAILAEEQEGRSRRCQPIGGEGRRTHSAKSAASLRVAPGSAGLRRRAGLPVGLTIGCAGLLANRPIARATRPRPLLGPAPSGRPMSRDALIALARLYERRSWRLHGLLRALVDASRRY